MRSARSPLLKEAGDLSSALTDARGRLIAQGRDIPIHLGVMAFTVKEFLRRVPRRELRDGDVWYLNLPEVGGNHLPDVKAIRPVFAGGRLVAFAINLAHWADIGGAVPGSYVPWADEADPGRASGSRRSRSSTGRAPRAPSTSSWRIVRGREEREGDCRAMYSAVEVGARRLGELFGRYGRPTVLGCFDRYRAESDAAMRRADPRHPRRRLRGRGLGRRRRPRGPAGAGPGDRHRPGRARGVRLHRHRRGGGRPDQRDAASSPASAVYYSLKSLVAPDVPANDGCYRPITVARARRARS